MPRDGSSPYYGLRCAAYADRRPMVFGIAMVAVIVALRVLLLGLLSLFLAVEDDETSATVILQGGVSRVVASFAFLPVETYLGQQLPISLLSKLGVSQPLGLTAVSAIVFGALHLFAGPAGFLTGASAGVVLSYGFLCWRQRSRRAAFWRTTAVHAAHNAVGFCIGLLAPI